MKTQKINISVFCVYIYISANLLQQSIQQQATGGSKGKPHLFYCYGVNNTK